jgi:hypothetical protein
MEGIWSVLERGPLANVAFTGFAHLLQVIKHGLRKIQYQAGGTCSYIMIAAAEITNIITVPDGTKIAGAGNPAIGRYLQVCFE